MKLLQATQVQTSLGLTCSMKNKQFRAQLKIRDILTSYQSMYDEHIKYVWIYLAFVLRFLLFLSFLFFLIFFFIINYHVNHFFFAKYIIICHNCTLKNSLSMTVTWIFVQVVYLIGNPQHFSPRSPAMNLRGGAMREGL